MTVQPEAPESEERSGLSRRTVIKGAAHAAWMVPAITVVTQAPAIAASGNNPVITATSNTWNGKKLTATMTIENKGTGATDAGMQVQVTVAAPPSGTYSKPELTSATAANWTVLSVTPNAATSSGSYTMLLQAVNSLPVNGTVTAGIIVNSSNNLNPTPPKPVSFQITSHS
jgi:hypothetical protein